MKTKIILASLLIFLFVCSSCTSDIPSPSPTETFIPTQTSTLTPVMLTHTPTPPPATATPTSVPTSTPAEPLSEEGPWLVYLHNIPEPSYYNHAAVLPELIVLNQDGFGRTSIIVPECGKDNLDDFFMNSGNLVRYMVQVDGSVYIIQPADAAGQVVYRPWGIFDCGTEFSGGVENGFLIRFYSTGEPIPYTTELILYELPSGEIHKQFPVFSCKDAPDVCNHLVSKEREVQSGEPAWSSDGRYLAFAAVVDTTDSDLFIYDTQTGNLRHYPHPDGWASDCEWSPDDTHIILQEIYFGGYPELLDDYYVAAVSSVSVSTGESTFLYAHEHGYSYFNITWLNNYRFFNYEGSQGINFGSNLRIVDWKTGTNQILFDGDFPYVTYDPIHETFLLFAHQTQEHERGYYFITITDGIVNFMYNLPFDGLVNFAWWDENVGLFVSDYACEDDPESLKAVDYLGNPSCVPELALIPKIVQADFPAPNGVWNLLVGEDGIRLQDGDNPAVLVSHEIPSDVIWCPDSSCFFYSVAQTDLTWTLYRVSLPDVTIEKIDEGIESTGSYQWVGGE